MSKPLFARNTLKSEADLRASAYHAARSANNQSPAVRTYGHRPTRAQGCAFLGQWEVETARHDARHENCPLPDRGNLSRRNAVRL